jgi:MSHA biogenesis protein MshE
MAFCRSQTEADKRIGAALAQRLKLMAGLDISEKRLPQDGRFSVRMKDTTDRCASVDLAHGLWRVGRDATAQSGLGHAPARRIGMPEVTSGAFARCWAKCRLVLVTGPTGSGKTTTLYAALAEINAAELKVITVEDPVEYRLPAYHRFRSMTRLSSPLHGFCAPVLRQDPDVILVGEMRDPETAEIGMRAAITGHLVLSTLHTRDAVSTPFRLLDMGVPPFMVSTSLQAVIAQRLVRLNCKECAAPHAPTPQEQSWLDSMVTAGEVINPKRGMGCSACNGSGYSGRQGCVRTAGDGRRAYPAASHSDPRPLCAPRANA